MMSNNRLMNSNAMSPTTDVDFAFAPMQPYLGFDAGITSAMPSVVVERPLLHQQHSNLVHDNNFDFGAAFPFQDSSSLLPPTSLPLLAPPPSMGMAVMPSSLLQMPPMMALPGLPTTELYPSFGSGSTSSFLKREDGPLVDSRIGLNLGRRTYFSPADVLAVDRLLTTRSRLGGGVGMGMGMGMGLGMAGMLGLGLGAAHHHQPPRCQAEGCKADLSAAKHYHRRHKVCDYHAKAAAVATGGKQQRFCQQCSRFHVLAEFDDTKRSCRKRLTEHNRRRRKPSSAQSPDSSPPPPKKADTTSITSSYNSDHSKNARTAAAAKSAAISPNGSGVSCLDMENGQTSTAAPTTLSLAALPLPAPEKDDGGLDTMLMQQVRGRVRGDDDEQHFMTSLVLQAQRQHPHDDGGSSHGVGVGVGGTILSCSSVSDHQQNGGCNGFFEVDFI